MRDSRAVDGQMGWVYFALAANGLVKIGFTIGDPEARVRSIGGASPEPVEFIAALAGGRDLEAAFHNRYRARRVRGEWFDPPEELLTFIREQQEPADEDGAPSAAFWLMWDVLADYEDAGRPKRPLVPR